MRWRVSSTISIGPIRFLRSASRNSATVLASTPAFLAGLAALRAVVFAALRAVCWRPRAWPPFFAAALRLDADAEPDELLRDEAEAERLLAARLVLERLLPDFLADERLADERLADERPPDDLLLDDVDRFDPPLDLPVLRRSAISPLPRRAAQGLSCLVLHARTISPPGPRRPHLPVRHDWRVVGRAQTPAVRLEQLALLCG